MRRASMIVMAALLALGGLGAAFAEQPEDGNTGRPSNPPCDANHGHPQENAAPCQEGWTGGGPPGNPPCDAGKAGQHNPHCQNGEEPTDPCEEDPTLPECEEPTDPCEEDPTLPECEEPVDPCEEDPTLPECEEPVDPCEEDPTLPECNGGVEEEWTCPEIEKNEDGLVSEPVHNSVEPLAGSVAQEAEDLVHTVNCAVVVDLLGL